MFVFAFVSEALRARKTHTRKFIYLSTPFYSLSKFSLSSPGELNVLGRHLRDKRGGGGKRGQTNLAGVILVIDVHNDGEDDRDDDKPYHLRHNCKIW